MRRVLITSAEGALGSSLQKQLKESPTVRLAVCEKVNLLDSTEVDEMYRRYRPELVIHNHEIGGGIAAHRAHPGEHFYANTAMALNLIENARRSGVSRFVYVGTADSYPRNISVPMKEANLWNGLPDSAHASYGIAKRIAAMMLEAYRSEYGLSGAYLVLTNVYGPDADFHPETSQVVAAMVRRFVEAADTGRDEVVCWGSGTVTRDFLYAGDAARGVVEAAFGYDSPEPLNLGSGVEVSIRELAETAAAAAGYSGRIVWDASRPDGVLRRCLDVTRARQLLEFSPRVDLEEGIRRMVRWWRSRQSSVRAPVASGPERC